MLTFIFVSVESLQPMLFTENFKVDPNNSGRDNANVLLADIITKILFAPLFGILSDRYGRPVVL